MIARRSAERWWPALATATGGLALAFGVWSEGTSPGPHAVAPTVASALAAARADSAGALREPAQPVAAARGVAALRERPGAEPAPAAATAVRRASAREAMAELARELAPLAFERARWAEAARAAARSLDERGAADLEAALAEGAAPIEELVAGAEMLRVLRPDPSDDAAHRSGATLPTRALEALRGALAKLPADPAAVAAARALAGAGAEYDAERLVDRLLLASDRLELDVARWALSVNRRPRIAEGLAEGVLGLAPDERLILALRALEEMRTESPDVVSVSTLDLTMRVLSLHLLDPATPGHVTASLVAVAQDLDPDGTRDILLACVGSADPDLARQAVQRLVHSGDEEAIRSVADRLLTSTSADESLSIAESLVLAWAEDSLTDDVRHTVVATLESTLLTDTDPAQRRRAVHGLGSTGEPGCAQSLLDAMIDDADPRVRGAAAAALGRLPDAARHVESFRLAAELEPSAVVRRTLAHELARLGA